MDRTYPSSVFHEEKTLLLELLEAGTCGKKFSALAKKMRCGLRFELQQARYRCPGQAWGLFLKEQARLLTCGSQMWKGA